MTDLTERQIARNRQTRDQQSFATHREHVMGLIAAAANSLSGTQSLNPADDPLPTMTVLGAGNCQDLDLPQLTRMFREVRLIDVDAAAVQAAVSHFESSVTSRIQILAPLDIAAPLMSLAAIALDDHDSASTVLQHLEAASLPENLPVSDVVVSTCLLSQLIDSASQIAPPGTPAFLPFIQAVRRGHLARMLQLTCGAGRALLITDLVSADTVPQLEMISMTDLPRLLHQCLQTGNFFSGLNPAVVQHDLQHIPACATLCAACQIVPPWRWTLGPRCFAVYAVEMVRC